ncbi:copper amine oxidase N-terminal domain-containing protein [Cytobacillus depressus]|uniref:Copper amine oxidase N-terminal domain-containing protein n=1 Tax=Cytobacillus depressus TaxID=1602942 RepID=A0A6L3V684_9BACI|nr:copper amine oxidase N-terminal domain-containing protein [Cytobacillus depressus]KAB2336744.1 copper amine oxidase N-terminal domain-containing protein [Cytobacillus depressus]
MKKTRSSISSLLALVLVFSLCIPFNQAEAAEKKSAITVTLDGKKINFDVPPEIKDGRVLVPFRAIFEAFGAYVQFDQSTKVVSSTKDDQMIELKVNSKLAYVNETEQKLDVPPLILNGRTLVPLRFIGENFNGQVDWNSSTKQVTIRTNSSSQPKPEPPSKPEKVIPVFLNNVELSLDTPPINLNNRIYVPLESFLDEMGNDIERARYDDEIYITMDGASITMFVNQNHAEVNGKYVTTNDYPIFHNGTIYAPVRYITDLFGGSVNITPGTSEVRITINRSKLRSSFLEKEAVDIVRPTNVAIASFSGNRRLMVSDNPENLNSNTIGFENATIWEDHVDTWENQMDHRVYGWHVNQLGKRVKVGITIENLSQTNNLEVLNAKGMARSGSSSWSHTDVGLPLAEALLSNKLPSINMTSPIVKANETVVIKDMWVENDFLLGFLTDFTVKKSSGSGNLSYKVRVVVSQYGEDVTDIKLPPVPTDKINSHPRGVWKSSQIVTELPVYQAGSAEVAYSISNGATDNLLSVEQSLGQGKYDVVKNPGHYGATYKVKIPIANYTGEAKTVRVRLGARGGMYNGAVKVNNDKVYMIPMINPGSEVANVGDFTINGTSETIELELMHSGGSALPVAIDILTLN